MHELLEFGLAIDVLDVAVVKLGDHLRSRGRKVRVYLGGRTLPFIVIWRSLIILWDVMHHCWHIILALRPRWVRDVHLI